MNVELEVRDKYAYPLLSQLGFSTAPRKTPKLRLLRIGDQEAGFHNIILPFGFGHDFDLDLEDMQFAVTYSTTDDNLHSVALETVPLETPKDAWTVWAKASDFYVSS
jgi:hypothetical protein